jgi:hypothetical protein
VCVCLCCCSAAELVAAQRLEAAEHRKMEEKERRLKQVRASTDEHVLRPCTYSADFGAPMQCP